MPPTKSHTADPAQSPSTAIRVDKEHSPLLAGSPSAGKSTEEAISESSTVRLAANGFVSAHLLGLTLIALSAFTFSILSVCIKYSAYSMPSMETVFWRSLIAWVFNIIAVHVKGVNLKVQKHQILPLATRCFGGAISMCLNFYAMQQMVLADATVLIFTSPLMTFIVGALVLKEHIDLISFVCALFSFVGVFFVARPSFLFGDDPSVAASQSLLPIACCLTSSVLMAFVYVAMRSLQGLNIMTTINYFLLTGMIIPGLSLAFVQKEFITDLTFTTWMTVLGSGITGFIGQLFMTRGFQLEKAGIASVMRYLDVVFVFIWDSTILGEAINPWSILGALIICGGAIAVTLRRMQSNESS